MGMRKGLLHQFLLAACSAGLLAASGAAARDQDRFAAATQERLAELGIGEDRVESIRYVLRRNVSEKPGPDIVGARAWIRLTDCTGYLVVDMNRSAYVRQTYTRGDCRVEGVPAY
jgi:hypothetical protein